MGGVVVIGGGLAGLAASHALASAGVPVTLLEKDAAVGGRTKTISVNLGPFIPEPVRGTPRNGSVQPHGALDVGGLVFFPGYGTVDTLIAAVGISHKVVPMVGRLNCLYQINGKVHKATALGGKYWWSIIKALAWLPFTPLTAGAGGAAGGRGETLSLWNFYLKLGLPNILVAALDVRSFLSSFAATATAAAVVVVVVVVVRLLLVQLTIRCRKYPPPTLHTAFKARYRGSCYGSLKEYPASVLARRRGSAAADLLSLLLPHWLLGSERSVSPLFSCCVSCCGCPLPPTMTFECAANHTFLVAHGQI
jgi:hypothetical protein